MLTIKLQGTEFWDEEDEVFRYSEETTLQFEHSLFAVSNWEARFHKLFLTKEEKTEEEMAGYIECMLQTPIEDLSILNRLSPNDLEKLSDYINDPMTGTTIHNMPESGTRSSERISSELVYYWMSQYQIDMSCEHWHLNRLFTLIRVHHAKSQKPKKMSNQKNIQTMAEMNAARKAKLGTSG